jgi:hypothetical protein
MEVQRHSFLTSASDLEKITPKTHGTGLWVGPRVDPNDLDSREVSCTQQESKQNSLVVQLAVCANTSEKVYDDSPKTHLVTTLYINTDTIPTFDELKNGKLCVFTAGTCGEE